MVFRVLALLLFALALPAGAPHWYFYPINTDYVENGKIVSHVSGLQFSFAAPPADVASVSGTVIDCDDEHAIAGEIDTDGSRGGTLLKFPIESLDGFRVKTLTVSIGGHSICVLAPSAGNRYHY